MNMLELRERLFNEQRGKCAFCWRTFNTHEMMHLHHAVIPKGQTNYKKFKKWLDTPENCVMSCWQCHEQHGDLTNDFMRDCVWTDKIDAGYEMQEWYDSIPMADKSHIFIYIHRGDGK